MRTTRQLSVTLPNEMAEMVRMKVRSGDYASESEVIREGLRALVAQERAIENWLRQEVGPAHDALVADPSRALPVQSVRDALALALARATEPAKAD